LVVLFLILFLTIRQFAIWICTGTSDNVHLITENCCFGNLGRGVFNPFSVLRMCLANA